MIAGLELEARHVLGALALAQLARRDTVARGAASRPAAASLRRCSSIVTPAGVGKLRQVVLAERDREVAALRDRHAVGERLGQVGEALGHLGLRREVLLGREAPRPARVGEDVAFRDAHARLVRPEVLARRELHGMRGDHGQRELARERHRGCDERVVVRTARALHLEVVALREPRRPVARGARRALGVALQQRGADVAMAARRTAR